MWQLLSGYATRPFYLTKDKSRNNFVEGRIQLRSDQTSLESHSIVYLLYFMWLKTNGQLQVERAYTIGLTLLNLSWLFEMCCSTRYSHIPILLFLKYNYCIMSAAAYIGALPEYYSHTRWKYLTMLFIIYMQIQPVNQAPLITACRNVYVLGVLYLAKITQSGCNSCLDFHNCAYVFIFTHFVFII